MDSSSRFLLHNLYRTLDVAMHSLVHASLPTNRLDEALRELDDVNNAIGDALKTRAADDGTLSSQLEALEVRLAHVMASISSGSPDPSGEPEGAHRTLESVTSPSCGECDRPADAFTMFQNLPSNA